MNSEGLAEQLVAEVLEIQARNPMDADRAVETHLENRLGAYPDAAKADIVDRMKQILTSAHAPPQAQGHAEMGDEVVEKLFDLILGKKQVDSNLTPQQRLTRLAEALNTVFDALNDLVRVINLTLMDQTRADETIRHSIGFSIEGESGDLPLEQYLGQVRNAFLDSLEAFKTATRNMVGDILDELDPDRIDKDAGGGRFTPFRKAASFDLYAHKHMQCQRWLASDRFGEDMQRKFETACGKRFASR